MQVLKNARVYRYDPSSRTYSRHGGLILERGRIRSLDPNEAGAGIETLDMGGATILPAFADCHVHLTDTGYFLNERFLGNTRSYDEFAQAVSRVPRDEFVFAGQYDESFWRDGGTADAAPLERNFPDSLAMLVRVDGHSCIVNRKTFAWLNLPPQTQGIERSERGEPTGKLFLEANWRAQSNFMKALPEPLKRHADRRAVELALSRGYLHLHVQLVGLPRDHYAVEVAALRDLPKAKWYPKICEPDARLAQELGLPYVGGDVFLDGSIGSCTAAVTEPFTTTGSSGELKYSDDELYVYFSNAEALGVSAGVHAIGDRAIEQCIATWERVLGGKRSARGNRHFIEHFEIARQEHIDACARMGIYLSMQPQFDELWGGMGQMYETRLGTQRMRTMNALGRIERAGAVLCGGDDSPVCNLSPLEGLQAALDHHEPSERLTPEQAVTMYTHNGARLAHVEHETGMLAPGFAADFVVLDRDPLDGARFTDCAVLSTWADGEPVFETSAVRRGTP
ncbi:MAG TPA: amidohydrolase family protein [Candidatus Baltobacteraceae bacterium]|nr:amidohydrolase family protein [Candidatus Baltobacteraceae bacterium]